MDEHLAANRANWDERTPVHLRSGFYDVDGWLREQRGPRPREVDALGDVAGLRIVHLQCHLGLEVLAFARAGATVVGVDFSPVAVEAARDLAARAGLAARAAFVCADVCDASRALPGRAFDVVYVSLGSLHWLPRVDPWAREVAALLVPGGRLYVHDVHPLSRTLRDDPLRIEDSYFEEPEPFAEEAVRSYTGSDDELANSRIFQWNHGLGEIVTALIAHGVRIDALEEHDWTDFGRFRSLVPDGDGRWLLPPGMPRVPLSFTLLGTRT